MTYQIEGLTGAEHSEFFGPEWYEDDEEDIFPMEEIDPADYEDFDEDVCPHCGGTVGHRVNCPDGIASSKA